MYERRSNKTRVSESFSLRQASSSLDFRSYGRRSRLGLHGSASRSFDKFIPIRVCVTTYRGWLDLDDVSTVISSQLPRDWQGQVCKEDGEFIPRLELDRRTISDVRIGLGITTRSSAFQGWNYHSRPCKMYRHGTCLEHARRRRQRVCCNNSCSKRNLSNCILFCLCLFLHYSVASLDQSVSICNCSKHQSLGRGSRRSGVPRIPFAMGIATRYALQNRKKEQNWYEEKFLRRLKPTALIGLLFTLVIMFSLQGNYFVQLPLTLLRVAIPLVVYFVVMFVSSFLLSWKLKFSYQETVTTSFMASNNFELAIATAVAVFGLSSSEAFATTVGPLIEVPVMIGLVYIALWFKPKLFKMVSEGKAKSVTEQVSKGMQAGKLCSFGLWPSKK